MKVAKVLALAAVTALVVSSSAFATGAVWFEAAPISPNATVDVQGARGGATGLKCDISLGLRCDWLITVVYQNDDGGAVGTALNLGTVDPADDQKFTIKDVTPLDSAANQGGGDLLGATNVPGGISGTVLIENAGNFTATPYGPGNFQLFTFILSKNKLPGELNTSNVFAGYGPGAFGGNDNPNGTEQVDLGPNPSNGVNAGLGAAYWPGAYYPFSAYAGVQPIPVISVMNTPEPATAVALIAGGLLLLRRRRMM